MRVELGRSDDGELTAALAGAIGRLGGATDGDADSLEPARGLTRYRLPGGEVTVFADVWGIDLEGPDELVTAVLAAMRGG